MMDKQTCPRCACPRSHLTNNPPLTGTLPYTTCDECEYVWTHDYWRRPQDSIVSLREWADHCGEEYDGPPTPYHCGIQAAKAKVMEILTRKSEPSVTMEGKQQ